MSERLGRRQVLKRLGTLAAVAVGGALAGCTGGGAGGGDDTDGGGSGSHTVEMTDDLAFAPDSVTVAVGDTVVWRNVGNLGHSVTAYEEEVPGGAAYWASGGFESEQAARDGYPDGDVPGGERYEHTFETPGTYRYFCIPHERSGMVGTVVVES